MNEYYCTTCDMYLDSDELDYHKEDNPSCQIASTLGEGQ